MSFCSLRISETTWSYVSRAVSTIWWISFSLLVYAGANIRWLQISLSTVPLPGYRETRQRLSCFRNPDEFNRPEEPTVSGYCYGLLHLSKENTLSKLILLYADLSYFAKSIEAGGPHHHHRNKNGPVAGTISLQELFCSLRGRVCIALAM